MPGSLSPRVSIPSPNLELSLICDHVVLSLLFASIVFAYYRQLLDPASTAYPRAPSDQIRMQAFQGGYPAPAGPPPGRGYTEDYVPQYDPYKLPGYDAQGRATPLEKQEEQKSWGAEASAAQAQSYAPPPGPPPQASNPFERRAEDP